MATTRRHFIAQGFAGCSLLATSLAVPRLAVAAAAPAGEQRFVFVVLRGGMDGLGAVPAPGDPGFAEARGALATSFGAAPLPLHDGFALHPLLPQLHAMYGRGELAVLHAVGLPYRERSHFDAQQVLESGGAKPFELGTGWLARALPRPGGGAPLKAVALETAVPLSLRGPAEVDTWAPSRLPEPTPDLVARLEGLYRHDPALAQALARARGLRAEAAAGETASMAPGAAGGGTRGAAVQLATKAAEFLQRGSQVAVLELGGWDTHANQTAGGPFGNNLRTLDATLAALREGLQRGGTWDRTAVLVATEFGREVAPNGTLGTDHGSGGAAFVLGGAVAGGKVLADWPGLAKKDRFEGRDLRTTTDLRAAMRTLLAEHLRVSIATLDTTVLPGTAGMKPLPLLKG